MSNKTDHLKRKQQIDDFDTNSDHKFDANKKMKIKEMKRFLMPMHVVTCGLQGVDLGRDETAVIQICITLIEVSKMEIIGERNLTLRASSLLDQDADPEKIHISIPAREMTGLLSIPNCDSHTSLRHALDEIDNLINSITIDDDTCEIDIIPVTVGHLPLRSVLHREARFRNIPLPNYWYSYFDLCDQMQFCYKTSFASMKDICAALQMIHCELSVSIISNMSQTVLFLLNYGHFFSSRYFVTIDYKPTVFHCNDPIDDDVVVVIKPIDYKTPISQVLPFFNGINIADGGVAVIMCDGRRSNKICVRLVDKIQRDIALLRDKHHLEPGSSRYITMSTFDSREFMRIAGYDDESVKNYLMRITNQEQVLIRLKGLPFTVTREEILEFFTLHETEIQFGLDGIYLVKRPSGDLNGDAFILFNDDIEATKATNLKGSMIGNRYVEIFHSTPAEMNQVIAGIKSGTILVKKTNKSREFENKDSQQISYQTPFSLLNEGLLQNILCNKADSRGCVTITSFIPLDATDGDFLKFLGEYQGICISITRQNTNNPKGYTSYMARFKDIYDAQLAIKSLSNKSFKIDLINKEFQVKTSTLPITGQSLFKTFITPNPLLQKSPLSSINIMPTVFPFSPAFIQPSCNLNNLVQMTAGSFLNYGAMQNLYSLNQYNQLSILPNALQSNFLNGQASPQLSFQAPISHGYISPTDFNINASANNFLFQKLPLSSNISQTVQLDKSRIVMLYGVQIQLLQQDSDEIFSSLIPYIATLPKLYQTNQLFYVIFSSTEDTKVALSRCPIILYKNQTIYLISIN